MKVNKNNKWFVFVIIAILMIGCIKTETEEVPSVFKTESFRIGDKTTYEVWGKNTVQTGSGFLIYNSIGEATIELKESEILDGANNTVKVLDFHMKTDETPSNHTGESDEDLPVKIDKHVYRIYDETTVGPIIKSVTVHNSINRDREIVVNNQPVGDIIDIFLQNSFNNSMTGSFEYENVSFIWETSYDKSLKAMRINLTTDTISLPNSSIKSSLWIKNGYSLPYQITFEAEEENQVNKYTYTLKKFERGTGKMLTLGNVNYQAHRDINYYNWKDYTAPLHGEDTNLAVDLQEAIIRGKASSTPYYNDFKSFLNENPDSYLVFANYWKHFDEEGWNLHFGEKNIQKDYVINVSNSGRTPIPSREINFYYLPYKELPKDIDNISDDLISIEEAESIFQSLIDYMEQNHSFRISFIEEYYPDTLFDLWEGNSKEKDISSFNSPRSATLVEGFYQVVKDYSYGYWLVVPNPPFAPEEFKINGETGIVTYTYNEY